MQKGELDGLRKRLPQTMQVAGLPGIDGTLGRFIGYTTTGAPVVTDQNLIRKGDWVISQDAHIWIAQIFFAGAWVWQDTFTIDIGQLLSTKGDLVVGTGSGNTARLGVGSAGQALTADATPSQGLIWANPRSGAETFLSRTGAISETIPRTQVNTVANALVSGTVFLQAIYLPKDKVITNIAWVSGNTAAVTPSHWWFTLCDNTRKTLRSTADQLTGAWAASTEQIKALSSTFTTTYEGLYYVGIMMAAATPITFATFTTAGQQIALAPLLQGTSSTGQTTAPADGTTLTAITFTQSAGYAYVS